MTFLLSVLLALPGCVLAGFSLYLLVLAFASLTRHEHSPPSSRPETTRLLVLVPAHDEVRLVGRCVRSLVAQDYPRYLLRVLVIADNCSDATAARAAEAGAEVVVRHEPDAPGKGQALRWCMDRELALSTWADAVVVVDADSVADPGLLAALELEHRAGHDVVQADYGLLTEPGSLRSELLTAAFLLFHRVRFSGRAQLGMAATLVGNGMLFSRSVLAAHPWSAFTGVEDLEYSIDLRMVGTRVRFAPSAHVAGPGPASAGGAAWQRLRWEGGRFHIVRTRLPQLLRAAARRRDPGMLETAIDLATPPLGLLLLVTLAGGLLASGAYFAGLSKWWAIVPWATSLGCVGAFVLVGLAAARAPRAVWRALLFAPVYIAWKSLTYLRLLRGFDPTRWERSDRAEDAPLAGARIEIAGVPVDPVDMAGALRRLKGAVVGGRLYQVSTINLDFMVRAQRDPEAMRIFRRCDLNLADGAPVVGLGRLLGASIPQRVAGADLVPALMALAAGMGARVFLLGGEGGVADVAAARLRERFPDLAIAGTYEPPRAAIEDMNNAEILARIADARPDILLVAFGHPKQERWIDLHRDQLQVSVAIGVGCVLDLIAGRSRRAPVWMQASGLEWAYRLLQEPRRLLRRYLVDAAWLVPIAAGIVRSRLTARRAVEAT